MISAIVAVAKRLGKLIVVIWSFFFRVIRRGWKATAPARRIVWARVQTVSIRRWLLLALLVSLYAMFKYNNGMFYKFLLASVVVVPLTYILWRLITWSRAFRILLLIVAGIVAIVGTVILSIYHYAFPAMKYWLGKIPWGWATRSTFGGLALLTFVVIGVWILKKTAFTLPKKRREEIWEKHNYKVKLAALWVSFYYLPTVIFPEWTRTHGWYEWSTVVPFVVTWTIAGYSTNPNGPPFLYKLAPGIIWGAIVLMVINVFVLHNEGAKNWITNVGRAVSTKLTASSMVPSTQSPTITTPKSVTFEAPEGTSDDGPWSEKKDTPGENMHWSSDIVSSFAFKLDDDSVVSCKNPCKDFSPGHTKTIQVQHRGKGTAKVTLIP